MFPTVPQNNLEIEREGALVGVEKGLEGVNKERRLLSFRSPA